MKAIRYALALTLLLAAAAPVQAHGFRCGARIIVAGDSVVKMLQACGQPTNVQTRYSQRTYTDDHGRTWHGFIEDVQIEEWTYNLGPYQLMRRIRVENGIVTDVRELGRGY
jgi:hypothetical protein